MHLMRSPKFCITSVFHFAWVLQWSQEKLKTMLMQNFGGQIRCILGDVQVAYEQLQQRNHREPSFLKLRPDAQVKTQVLS